MKIFSRYLIIAMVAIAFGIYFYSIKTMAFGSGSGQIYSYAESGVIDVELNAQGDRLYASYHGAHCIIEINTNTMEETRRFNVDWPTYMDISPDGSFLYAIKFYDPCEFVRIRLSDGQINRIQLEGEAKDFVLNANASKAWLVRRLWPLYPTPYSDPNYDAPPATGRLSEIDLTTFTVTQTQTIESMPESIWYSPVAERLFVYHGLTNAIIETIPVSPGSNRVYERLLEEHERITIYDVSMPGFIRVEPEELDGGGHLISWHTARLSNWDDAGTFMAIPSPVHSLPPFSMRVANAVDLSTFDLTFDDANGNPIGALYFKKVPGQNVMWVANDTGNDIPGITATRKFAVRVETTPPYNHEIYIVDEATDQYGDFAVSPDGNTLYLTLWKTGEIIVWSPD